jgi:hypothetical protein
MNALFSKKPDSLLNSSTTLPLHTRDDLVFTHDLLVVFYLVESLVTFSTMYENNIILTSLAFYCSNTRRVES